jgi:SAM-dependent methyltransferase
MRDNPLTESRTPTHPTPYSKDEWEIVECDETGMVFLANPPDYESLVEEFAWEKTYAEEKASRRKREPVVAFLSTCVKKIRRAIRPRDRIVTEGVQALKDLQKQHGIDQPVIADVGCGIADKAVAITKLAAEAHGIQVVPLGIEISSGQAVVVEEVLSPFGGRCIQNTAIEGLAEMDPASVDLVILCSFLEHEVNPLPLLRQCARVIKPHGKVIIKVPNFGSLNRKIRQKRWCGFRYPDHVNYFTPATLRAMVSGAGLSIHRMNFFDTMPTSDNMWAIVGHPEN